MAQTLLMAQATVLAVLVITERAQVWHLVGLAIFSGLVNGADIPARQSMLVRLVGGAEDHMISYFVAFYASRTINWGMAAALSLMLLFATIALYAVYNRLVGFERLRLG